MLSKQVMCNAITTAGVTLLLDLSLPPPWSYHSSCHCRMESPSCFWFGVTHAGATLLSLVRCHPRWSYPLAFGLGSPALEPPSCPWFCVIHVTLLLFSAVTSARTTPAVASCHCQALQPLEPSYCPWSGESHPPALTLGQYML